MKKSGNKQGFIRVLWFFSWPISVDKCSMVIHLPPREWKMGLLDTREVEKDHAVNITARLKQFMVTWIMVILHTWRHMTCWKIKTRYSTDSFIYRFFIRRENHALIPSIELLPFGYATLHYMLDALLFLHPQRLPYKEDFLSPSVQTTSRFLRNGKQVPGCDLTLQTPS